MGGEIGAAVDGFHGDPHLQPRIDRDARRREARGSAGVGADA
jgi:hypothetical protein